MKKNLTIAWLKTKNKHLKYPIFILSLLSLVLSLTAILFAFFSKETIDSAVSANEELFIISAVILTSLIIVQIICQGLNAYLKTYYQGQTNIIFKDQLFNKILKSKLKDTSKIHSGALMNYLNSDVENVSDGLIDVIPKLIFFVVRFMGAFVLLFILDSMFAILFAGFGVLLLTGSRLMSKEMKKRHHKLQDAEANLRSFMQEGLENVSVIKSFESEALMSKKLSDLQSAHFKALRKKQKLSIFASTGMNIFFGFGYAFAIIFGAFRLKEGFITFGALTALIQLVSHIQSPFSGLSQLLPKYYTMMASAERLMTLDAFELETPNITKRQTDFDTLTIQKLSFKYDTNMVMSKLNLKINFGEFVHIHGESGKGKTTLFKLLLGLYQPLEGFIFFTIKKSKFLCDASTRNLFSYVPQGNFILSGTIRENLELYQKASDDELYNALRISCLYDDIKALPDQLDTRLGEKGLGLSEGQIQRLAIARALLKNAPIMLLDEITSALDPETEKKIFSNIKSLTNKTCLIISHRKLPDDLIDQAINL
ncbi:MAG: ABC transporter ATP-binding protein [Acholeplasmataceae bacterium]|nr:ABC transporter ATP-binding protein [Acholeplasmataceae bacterium]